MNAVGLMSCGQTDPELITLLAETLERHGLLPFHVLRESWASCSTGSGQ